MRGARPSQPDGGFGWVVARGIVAVGATVFLAQLVSEEITGTFCNETDNFEPGTTIASGCHFLADIGYTLIEVVPAVVAAGFAVAGLCTGRQRLVWLGFAVAFFLLLLAAFVEPGDYPWATGRDR